ncbi:MAG: SprT family zinc-dependent metalloprotease [Bacteroidales bacterium]|nr:M48 family metallopeptidase [Bacteroidales bacterium]MDD2204339.1 SprT family zinc-dependent metalloprotease [Bacteroidales bacterium]MDD3913220.1 SprT family zinc-dependent metalloprotease [Bacteroidales bacterium]
MTDELQYGTIKLRYTIELCRRKTLGISVYPDGSVVVKAPEDATAERIREKVHSRAAWIIKQQRYFKSFGEHTPERRYISGESHLYLGRQYMLRIIDSKKDEVHYKGNIIEIECRHRKDAEDLLSAWYFGRAEQKFSEYAQPLIERFRKYGVEPTVIDIRYMKTRWGSCSPKGKITLNPAIIKAPPVCIEYVITHELCHLVHKNHTKAFYDLLTTEMPNWEKWKAKLEKIMM